MLVKSASRVIDVLEAYARHGRPMLLSELAAALNMPLSSTAGLVATLEAKGYLYSVNRRAGYYPTRRLLAIARVIAASDPILERIGPILASLRDDTGETVLFGKRQGRQLVYLDAYESPHRIRYSAKPGEFRELHSNSFGKAILARMSQEERAEVLGPEPWMRHTASTRVTTSELEPDLREGQVRGWFLNRSESIDDVMAIGMAVAVNDEIHGLSVVGPIHRMEPHLDRLVAALRLAVRAIEGGE